MGAFVNKYAFELQQAALDLEVAMNSSRKVLDAATAADHSNAFAGPEVESRSKVIVALESAARSVRSARRQFDHLVDQAQGDAEQSLEDSADTLGRRVGDMTPVLDQAKASLQSAVEQREAATAKWHSDDKANSTSSKGDAVSRMQALAAYVKSAQAANKARTAAAKETVDASIAKADKQLAAKVKEMIADLMAAEQAEIRDLRGPLTFSVKLLRGPKKNKRAGNKGKAISEGCGEARGEGGIPTSGQTSCNIRSKAGFEAISEACCEASIQGLGRSKDAEDHFTKCC